MALLGFCMPPETGEKINMLNTVWGLFLFFFGLIFCSLQPMSGVKGTYGEEGCEANQASNVKGT